jgi:60 kDa SS-A/Ro ribonucleoprotein
MSDVLSTVRTRNAVTPQVMQADPRQSRNNAGGFTFTIDSGARIYRFLTIGTAGGTFYVNEKNLTRDNADVVLDMARRNPAELARMAAEISEAGRAPSNNPALLAVAAAMSLGGTEEGRRAAADMLPRVARTGSHLLTAARYVEQFRGWGRIARRAFASWYLDYEAGDLAYQLIKYRHRGGDTEGWSHRDVLRSAHSTKGADPDHAALFDLVCGRGVSDRALPKWAVAFRRAQEIGRSTGSPVAKYVSLIEDYPGLPWEALPDEATGKAEVWRALIEAGLPVTALLRNLPKLTRLGVLAPLSSHLRMVTERLGDGELLVRGRVHPVAVLTALRTYASGHSISGSSRWVPVPQVVDVLGGAFYLSFGSVEPAGKRTLLCTDVSGSMTWPINRQHFRYLPPGFDGYPFTAGEIAGAMAMAIARFEPDWAVMGFADGIRPLPVTPSMRLDEVLRIMRVSSFGSTDCSAPIVWARQNRVDVDTFAVITDNETYAGRVHPHEALRDYRQATGIDARLQVVAVVPTEFSIADPADPRQLDVSGFDSAAPVLLANHSAGRV